MSGVSIKGLEAWRRRLDGRHLPRVARETLRQEAEAVAGAAARAAPGRLGQTVEILDESKGGKVAYAIGTPHPAGWFLEHGTVRQPARPWLGPALRARLPRVKQRLRNSLVESFGARRGGV